MKILVIISLFCFSFTACGEQYASYTVLFPDIPSGWLEILGQPQWRLEWIDDEGCKVSADAPYNGFREIRVLREWASPITAFPFWSEKGVPPKLMKPAGAIFPFDVSGGNIILTWFGGVEAVVYQELAQSSGESSPRSPNYFNWPRFKELFEDSLLPEAVKSDPWLVDWKAFCEKTATSGFDRRRIKIMEKDSLAIPVALDGVWVGTSPFARPFSAENGVLTLNVDETIDVYFSKQGMIKITKSAWIKVDF
jgi:hypothetical protein